MSVVLCNGDDVKIVQNGFIMRDHCIQLMLRPHSLLLQSHRDQRSLTLPCCLSCLLPFLSIFCNSISLDLNIVVDYLVC